MEGCPLKTQPKNWGLVTTIWQAGVNAVAPADLVRQHIRWSGGYLHVCGKPWDTNLGQNLYVVAAGKAAEHMAKGFLESTAHVDRPIVGHVLHTGQGKKTVGPLSYWGVRPEGINLPTPSAVAATKQVIDSVTKAAPEDLLLVLLSGGASAMLCAPNGVTLEEKIRVTQELAGKGASIHELNTVRQTFSKVKAGGLLNAFSGARAATLAISDVIDDDPLIIGSGPTVISNQNVSAQTILDRYGVKVNRTTECPEPSTTAQDSTEHDYHVIGNNRIAREAAMRKAEELGYKVIMLPNLLEGAVQGTAMRLVKHMRALIQEELPTCLISGGETTVELPNKAGKGGRNLHLAALVAEAWDKWPPGCTFLSAGTDGEDGNTTSAGAWVDEQVHQRLKNHDLGKFIANANTFDAFAMTAGLFSPGLTHTNVMDLQVTAWNP